MATRTTEAPTAIARAHANLNAEIKGQLLAALNGQGSADADYGDASLDDVEGLSPDMPLSVSLSEMVNAVVRVVFCRPIPNQFAKERAGASEIAAEFIWQDKEDERFYRAVSSSALALRNLDTFTRLLTGGYSGVNARIVAVPVKDQANDAYGFGAVNGG